MLSENYSITKFKKPTTVKSSKDFTVWFYNKFKKLGDKDFFIGLSYVHHCENITEAINQAINSLDKEKIPKYCDVSDIEVFCAFEGIIKSGIIIDEINQGFELPQKKKD